LPGGPLWLEGNASLLQQLVANLLLNAANAMVHKCGHIELAIEAVDDVAVLRVTDNGRGIPAEDLPKVFDPFFTTMPVGKGTGLGLSISYAIVQQHGGTIEMESEEGRGTTVTVALPLQRTGGEV
jgi:signal transduction histidine kinase